MRKKLLAWLVANEDNAKYEGKLGELQKQEDFNAEFDKQMTLIKKTDQYNSLFNKGQFEITGKSSVQILEEKMEVAEKNTITLDQKIGDALTMSAEGFLAKYGVSLKDFKKENNLK